MADAVERNRFSVACRSYQSDVVRAYRMPAGGGMLTGGDVFAGDLYQPYGIAFYPPVQIRSGSTSA